MTLEEIACVPLAGKSVLIIGSPASGKTYLSQILGPMNPRHDVIHTDKYLKMYDNVGRSVYAAFEDAAHYKSVIIEGVLGYEILLEGYKNKSYYPDIIIEVQLSAGKQREIYLSERDANKLRHLRHFQLLNQAKLNEYFRICPKDQQPIFIEYQNQF